MTDAGPHRPRRTRRRPLVLGLVTGVVLVAGVVIAVLVASAPDDDDPGRPPSADEDDVTDSPTAEQIEAATEFGALVLPQSAEVLAIAHDDDRGGTYRLVLTVPPGDVAPLLADSGITDEPFPSTGAAVVTVPGHELAEDAPILRTQNQVGVPTHGQVVRTIAIDESDPETTTVHALLFVP